jgi:hypothetical protein
MVILELFILFKIFIVIGRVVFSGAGGVVFLGSWGLHIHKRKECSVGVWREMVALEVTFHHFIALLDKTCSIG